MKPWKFYGRADHIQALQTITARKQWFFAKVSGRRRIGKTSLITSVINSGERLNPILYIQIPDSEENGVLSAVADFMQIFHVPLERYPAPNSLLEFAKLIENLAADGYVVVLDEFQYFNRPGRVQFCSFLQAVVDRLSSKSHNVPGGLVVLGSIHTEMEALLENRNAPLYNRVTDSIEVGHLDIATIVELLSDHDCFDCERLLFLWNLFEGVPKFYRDCYEQDVLNADRKTLLKKLFFDSSSALRTEAETWHLSEFKGRYDAILKFVARHPGCSHSDFQSYLTSTNSNELTKTGPYLTALIERYGILEKRQPIFAKANARKSRYYLNDNFLKAWLAALSTPVAAIMFRPLEYLLDEADRQLMQIEGGALEKLAWQLYEERSRRGVGDFALTARVQGYWNKGVTEIDLVAIDETRKIIRFGSCKRSPSKLISDINNFKQHVQRFLTEMPQFESWHKELVAIAPTLDNDERKSLQRLEVRAQDLGDLTDGLL
jgi:uncharacterized protein